MFKRLAARRAKRELERMALEFPSLPDEPSHYDNDPKLQWLASGREYVEVIQGPAAEAQFSEAWEDFGAAASRLASGLDVDRIPSWFAVGSAIKERRRKATKYQAHRRQIAALFEQERRVARRRNT